METLPSEYTVYEDSRIEVDGTELALICNGEHEKSLLVRGERKNYFQDKKEEIGDSILYPLSVENAYLLMELCSWLQPRTAGLEKTFGCGDRIGLATPGHVRAFEDCEILPVFAQQSIREMERTERNPREVMATAIWGMFEEGYRGGYVADADHLMTQEDVEITAEAGFTMFTCDPSEHVRDVEEMTASEIEEEFAALDESERLLSAYEGCEFTASLSDFDYTISDRFTRRDVMCAAVKYYKAIEFAAQMRQWVVENTDYDFDYEVSVDETANPTSPLEHYFIIKELERMGITFESLALRFVGDIQKGIDYIGDIGEFEEEFTKHAAIADTYGPYKLSLHSGSDKFSIYPAIGKYTSGCYHVKTAGTSYLEAVRVVAERDPGLFSEIYEFAFERFPEDKATYHVTTDLSILPAPGELDPEDYPELLTRDDSRQLLHITYGSVLSWKEEGEYRFRDRLLAALRENENLHYEFLKNHISHHLDLLGG